MNRMNLKKLFFLLTLSAFLFPGCSEEEDQTLSLVVDIKSVTEITIDGATIEAMVLTVGETAITEKGFCYSTQPDPTIEDQKVEVPVASDFKTVLALDSNTKYYVRAYAKNQNETIYSASRIFTTPKPNQVLLSESFDAALPTTWANIDKDGDGFMWSHDAAKKYVYSKSFDVPSNKALTPENYLVSPELNVPSDAVTVELTFDIAARYGAGYHKEAYKIVVSEQPITLDNAPQATTVKPYYTLTVDYEWEQFQTINVNLTAYKGKKIYVGFVHGNCTDNDALVLRNVTVRAIF